MKKFFVVLSIFILSFHLNINANENTILIKYKVNEDLITNYDILKETQYLKVLNNDLFSTLNNNQINEIAENSLIREKIKKYEIEKYYEVNYQAESANFFVNDLRNKLGIQNQSDFEDYLSDYGLTIQEIKTKFVIEQTWNKMILTIYKDRIVIDEKKISKTLEQLINEKKKQKSFNLSEIVFSEKNKDDFKRKYDEIISSIEKFGFEKTALIFSISNTSSLDGKIGWINQNQLSKNILKELEKIEIGSYTKPINNAGGALILRLNDIKEISPEDLDKERELSNIINAEKNRQLNEFSIIHYKKTENKSYVKKF